MTSSRLQQTIQLIDNANSEDPNSVVDEKGQSWPKELLYSHRMTDMLNRFKPDADEVAQIAIRAQHIMRWTSRRDAYSMDRKGYHQWRTQLYTFHANTAADLMHQAGYDEESIERVRKAVGKRGIKTNPDTQLLEDVTDLVFMEHYMLAFAQKHSEYDEQKWIDIIRKTWNKMSSEAQQFALDGKITLPESLMPLIQKAIS